MVNIKTTSSYESTLQKSSEHLGTKKRSRKSTNKMNVICKRARIEKIARRKYPKTLKEWENKLLKPLPAVSDQSLFWGGVLLPKMVRKESIRKRIISHITNRESRNCGWMRERERQWKSSADSSTYSLWNDATNQDKYFKQIENRMRWDKRR